MSLKQVDNTHIYALAEHVALLQSGWWEDAIDRTLQYVLFQSVQGLSEEELLRQTKNQLDAQHDRHLIQERLDHLTARGDLFKDKNLFYLTEKVRDEYSRLQTEAEDLQKRIQDRYERILQPHRTLIKLLPSWFEFSQDLLIPVINELGARTMELLRGEMPIPRTEAYSKFISRFPDEDKMAIQALIISFLDPEDRAVRSYIYGHLNHYMLVRSSSLDKKTLDRIAIGTDETPTFRILLDTNILFSILNLHYNPANAAAQALVELTKVIDSYVDVGLYVSPRTLDEAKSSLTSARDQAPRGRVTRSMAQAAEEVGNISGLLGRYMQLSTQGSAGSPSSYFNDLIDGLEIILEEKGVIILPEEIELIEERISYKDAVDKWFSFQYGKKNGRGRNQIRHDLFCLTYIKDQRKGKNAGFAHAEWWFLTADLGLQSYEKKVSGRIGVPLSINPAEMVQMLRFWVPRRDRLESALVGGIRLPFSFFQGEKNAQKTSVEILNLMSRYSNVESFSTDLAERLLTDRSLRASLESGRAGPEDEKLDVFESVLAEEIEALEKQAADLKSSGEKLALELEVAKRKASFRTIVAEGKETSKASLLADLRRSEKELEKVRNQSKARGVTHAEELKKFQTLASDSQEKFEVLERSFRERRSAIRKTWIIWFLFIIFTALIIAACISFALAHHWSAWVLGLAICVSLLISLWLGVALTKVLALSVTSRTVGLFKICATQLWGYIGAGVIALLIAFAVAPPK